MVWIAGTNTSGASTYTFSSIPQTFTHLQLRVFARAGNVSFTADTMYLRLNGVSAANNYAYHYLRGNGTSAISAGFANDSFMVIGNASSAAATAGIFGVAITDILDYTNTNKNKTIRTISGNDRNASSVDDVAQLSGGLFLSTAAITSLTFGFLTAAIADGSRIDLYGITTSQVTGA